MKKLKKFFVFLGIILIIMIGYYLLKSPRVAVMIDSISDNSSSIIALGNISINYLEGEKIISNNMTNNKTITSNFSVSNNGSQVAYYSIGIMTIKTNISDPENILLTIESDNQGGNINQVILPLNDESVLDSIAINPGQTQRYKLAITYQGEASNKSLSGQIYVILDSKREYGLADTLLRNNPIVKPKTNPGEELAVLNEGLIEDQDDYGKTYYFRGQSNNNYVRFAERDWQIVRLNGNGTIKLILVEALPNKQLYYSKQGKTNEEYLMMGDLTKTDIIKYLNSWYATNLINYDQFIANTKYCLTTVSPVLTGDDQFFNSYLQISVNKKPTFLCLEASSSLKIGLLSADEVIMAGGLFEEPNLSYYLFNENQTNSWWTLSPHHLNHKDKIGYLYAVNEKGSLIDSVKSDNQLAIRPTISLNNLLVVSGNGLKESPYIVSLLAK